MDLITRQDARARGLTHYFTGRPCKNGHMCERLVCNKTCRLCANLISNRCKRANWSKYLKLIQDWQKNNPDRMAQYQRNQNQKNPGRRNFWTKQYRLSKEQRMPPWLNAGDQFEIESIYVYCGGLRTAGLDYHVDHVIPMRGETVSGLHVPWNLQVIPGSVNTSKGNRFVYVEG